MPGRIGFCFILRCGSKRRALQGTGRKWWSLSRVREESYAWKTLPKLYCYGYLIDNLKVGRHEIRCLLILWPLSFATITWLVIPEVPGFEGAFGKEW